MTVSQKRLLMIMVLSMVVNLSFGQSKKFSILNTNFEIETSYVQNEWQTTDTMNTLYEQINENRRALLNFYTYKDEGGDCNNLFWNKSELRITTDSLLFLTHYFQKTGLDPIPEFRKQIYQVTKDGRFNRIYNKYKYRNKDEWVTRD